MKKKSVTRSTKHKARFKFPRVTICPWELARTYVKYSVAPQDLRDRALGYIRARDHEGASNFGVSFNNTLEEARFNLQFSAFFKKLDSGFGSDEQRIDAARQSFERGELNCRLTNKRLFFYRDHPERDSFSKEKEKMRKFLSKFFGEPSEFLSHFEESMRLTSGATALTPRKRSQAHRKLRSFWPTSSASVDLVQRHLNNQGLRTSVQPCDTNRIAFVPKSWKTFRTIAAEPAGMIPYQLAIDVCFKRRLRYYGIDLQNQQLNADLARYASVMETYSTIDLQNASNSLSLAVVQDLFPPWVIDLLFLFRSPKYRFPGEKEEHRYSMWSSMGNGYTFPLETTLFLAAAKAVGSKNVAVYGDDIIIENHLDDKVIALLRHIGFQTNEEKSFTSGPFRESCGGNFYRGTDITPARMLQSTLYGSDLALFLNKLLRCGGVKEGWTTYVISLAKLGKIPYVPDSAPDDTGLCLPPYLAYLNGMQVRTSTRNWIPHYWGIRSRSSRRSEPYQRQAYWLWLVITRNREISEARGVVPTDFVVTSKEQRTSRRENVGWLRYWVYQG